MSYQDSKESIINDDLSIQSSLMFKTNPKIHKTKKNGKSNRNYGEMEDDDGNYQCKNKKQMAKQIKRKREQNRRANHKQYVATLQQQIKRKDQEIQELTNRITGLQQQLQSKLCHKCNNQVTEITHPSPFIQQISAQLENQCSELEMDEDYRRITDEGSLKICFGNKSFLFFLVTMCCLTIGSIADNPEIFLQPIHPIMVRSQLCYLQQSEKLHSFKNYHYAKNEKKNYWNFKIQGQHTNIPQIYEIGMKMSQKMSSQEIFAWIKPTYLQFLPNIKDPSQILLSFQTNNFFGRFFGGGNYYYNFR